MTQLLRDIFNQDFASLASEADFAGVFFAKTLTLADLRKVSSYICAQSTTIEGETIPASLRIKGKIPGAPLILLSQLHGNEPAGLAAILLVLALKEAQLLERDVLAVIGNPLAATQYFEHLSAHPHTRQETRDAFRCGLSDTGQLLPDMNRIPTDFLTRENPDHHITRARELYALGLHSQGILDIHSARGNMLCITDHKHDSELKHSPIRALLTHLADAIAAHASAATSVVTFKTIMHPLPNIKYQVGIEAGRHEAPDSPYNAASFALAFFHTNGWTSVPPLQRNESNIFDGYEVSPRITYADLEYGAGLRADDKVYMATPCQSVASVPERSDTVVVRHHEGQYVLQNLADFTQKPQGTMEYALYQYDEMEPIPAGHTVAVAVPSGTSFKSKKGFAGIFLSKSGALYDKDPSVGPWPVAADKIASVKFCYPCTIGPVKLDF